MTTEKKLLASSLATKRYREKKQTKRYAFDLYLDEETQKRISEILDKQKENQKLKEYIVQAIKNYEKLE